MIEQSLVILKPDAVKRKLTGKILQRFEEKNLTIKEMKLTQLTENLVKEHYKHLEGKSFYSEVIQFMISGSVVCLIIEGEEAIKVVRQMVGATNALTAAAGTIRGDFGGSGSQNIIHASDSTESAEKEMQLFFGNVT